MNVEDVLPHRELTRVIIGAAYTVHSDLGCGFLESVYANALAVQLSQLGLRVEREVPFTVDYLGVSVGFYRADMIVESKVLVENKARQAIQIADRNQAVNYLSASRLEVGLIINFGLKVEVRRLFARDHVGRRRTA